MAPIAVQIPIAVARSPRGKTAVRIESVAGITSAAPSPCSPRNTISVSTFVESAAPTAAAPKIAIPIASQRLRPKRSPMLPPTSSKPARIKM